MDKVSIIIPAYNSGRFIDKCIISIMNQTYEKLEIIVIDDGSTDNTPQIVREYSLRDKRIALFHNTGKGVSSARNYGLNKASGEYITFVDADDVVSPSFIFSLVNMIKCQNCDCASVMYTSNIEELQSEELSNSFTILDNNKYSLLVNNNGFVWNKMYKLSIIKARGIEFDEHISVGEDMLFNNLYFKESNNIVCSNDKLYYYRLNLYSAVNKLDNPKWFDIIKVYIELLNTKMPDNIYRTLNFKFEQILLEANYRSQFCKESDFSDIDIKALVNKYVGLNKDFSLIQNMKILLFKVFPKLTMKYKRRSIT